MSDELLGQGGAGTETGTPNQGTIPPGQTEPVGGMGTAPSGTAPANLPTDGAAPSGAVTPTSGAGTGQQGGGQPGGGWNARQYAASLGVQGADQFQDDQQFVQALLARAQRAAELEQVAPYGQLYQQNQVAFEQWRQAQA